MIPSIQNKSIDLPNHQPAQVSPVHVQSQCAKSTLSQGAKGDGLVMSILKPIGRFFSWLWSSIMSLFTCCKKSPMPKLPDSVVAAMVKKREDFDNRDSMEIICGWGLGTGNVGTYADGGKFGGDLEAAGISYNQFQGLYSSDALCEGKNLRAIGIHEELADYLDLKVEVGTFIEIMKCRIEEIGHAKLTKPLSDALAQVQSKGLITEVEADVRAAEKTICLNQFRQYMQTVS